MRVYDLEIKGVEKSLPPIGPDMRFEIINRPKGFRLYGTFSAFAPCIWIGSILGHDLISSRKKCMCFQYIKFIRGLTLLYILQGLTL